MPATVRLRSWRQLYFFQCPLLRDSSNERRNLGSQINNLLGIVFVFLPDLLLQFVYPRFSLLLLNFYSLFFQVLHGSRCRVRYQEICFQLRLQLCLVMRHFTAFKHFQCNVAHLAYKVVRHVCKHGGLCSHNLWQGAWLHRKTSRFQLNSGAAGR